MTTYSAISNAAVAVGGIPSSSTVSALRDNPIAIAEASSGAPIVASGWHPVDKVTVGDGKSGLIYNSATDGVKANVETPNFEDGYEYRLIGVDVSGAGSGALNIQVYGETAATYDTNFSLVNFGGMASGVYSITFDVELLTPRTVNTFHICRCVGAITDNATPTATRTLSTTTAGMHWYYTAQKIQKVRVIINPASPVNIDGGKIYLFRRREFATLA